MQPPSKTERKPDPSPPDDLAALRDFPGAVKDLAASIRETPATVARELKAVETAYKTGVATGVLASVLVFVAVSIAVAWVRRNVLRAG